MKESSTSTLHKIKILIFKHKIVSAIVALVLIYGGYKTFFAAGTTTETKYMIGQVEKGTVISVVSGTGQVSASSQIDLKSKASGRIIYIGAADGQEVKAGTLIAQVDSRSAGISLENARISLAKLTQAADPTSVSQFQNDLNNAIESSKKAVSNLSADYTTALGIISATFIDMPSVLDGMNTMFYTTSGTLNSVDTVYLPSTAREYMASAGQNLDAAKRAYTANLADYKNISADTSTSSIEKLIDETKNTTAVLTAAVKDAKATVDYVQNQNNNSNSLKNIPTAQTNLNGWLSKLTGHVSDLENIVNTIKSDKVNVDSAARDIDQKTLSLQKLKDGADPLDVQSQQLSVRQQEYNYEDSFTRAPFDGVIAKLDVNKGDDASSGTVIGTFISKNKIANISLNEVDVSKIKVGQKVTMTFDAIDGLTIVGHVLEVDLVGTVTQGVVTYNVKIGLDTDDDRVRSGMSVSANIATDVRQDVLVVPSTAIKTQGNASYVGVFDKSIAASSTTSTVPTQQQVTIGISDDLNTEIISGLSLGDKISTKTVQTTTKTATSQAPSLLNAVGGNRTGATRVQGGGGLGR